MSATSIKHDLPQGRPDDEFAQQYPNCTAPPAAPVHGARQHRILFVGPRGLCGISTVHEGVLRLVALSGNIRFRNVDTVPTRRGNRILGYLALYFRCVREILSFRPDSVYLQISQTGYLHQSLVLLIAKVFGRRTIAHFHAKPNLRASTSKSQFRWLMWSRRYIDEFIVLAADSKRDMTAEGCRSDRVTVIPNFLNRDDFPEHAVPVQDRKFIVFVGRMTWAKGIFDIVKLAKLLPDEHFVLFGPFESRSEELSFLEAARSLPNLEWRGPVCGEEKLKWISAAKITLLPSLTEVFPMSVLESSFCHTPSAITPVGMVPEVVEDGVDGILIEWAETERNAATLRHWLERPAELGRIGRAARKRAEDRYSAEGVREDLFRVILPPHKSLSNRCPKRAICGPFQ